MGAARALLGTLIALCLCATVAIDGAVYSDNTASLGSSAGMIGMGTIEGFGHNASVLLDSPGGLSQAGSGASIFYTSLFGGDVTHLSGAISGKWRSNFTVGIGVQYEGVPNIDYTSVSGSGDVASDSTFDYASFRYVVGACYDIDPKFSIGVSWVEYRKNMLGLIGEGGDLSVGIRRRIVGGELLLNGKNLLGRTVIYNSGAVELLDQEGSVGFKSDPLVFLDTELFVQLKYKKSVPTIMRAAGAKIYPIESKLMAISVGYKEDGSAIVPVKGGGTVGLSLDLDPLIFEYAYDTSDVYQQEAQHFVSMVMRF